MRFCKAFALSSAHLSFPPAVTSPQVLHQAIDCFAVGTRSAQANCFNHVRIFRGTALRTSQRFIFHDLPTLSLCALPLSRDHSESTSSSASTLAVPSSF